MIGDGLTDTAVALPTISQVADNTGDNIFVILGVIGAGLSVIAWASFILGAIKLVSMLRQAQPDYSRTRHPLRRFYHMMVEFIAHTRMMRRRTVGLSHWFVMVGFLLGSLVWFEAYIQIFDPSGGWPWLHYQPWYHLIDEVLGLTTILFGVTLAIIRQLHNPTFYRSKHKSRFYQSNSRAAYFVEAVVIIEGIGMVLVKAGQIATYPEYGGGHPTTDWVSMWIAQLLPASPLMVSLFAMMKLLTGMVWLFVVGRNLHWGVAWHRFGAFFNIFFKREEDGRSAQRSLRPMTTTVTVPKKDTNPDGKKKRAVKTLTLENVDPEVDKLGVGRIDEFTWKDWLDFSVCTECGRCQDLCPAWNSGKPLNPKTLITGLRDVAHTAAPYLADARKHGLVDPDTGMVSEDAFPRLVDMLPDNPTSTQQRDKANLELLSRPLIGLTPEKADTLGLSEEERVNRIGIIDEDILWACTNCGACVDQCPLDIEHLDHVANLRRHQVLAEDQYPENLTNLFRNLITRGNPWGQSPTLRETWIDELERESGFRVPVWGKDVHDFAGEGMEYLFWVGCAGAYDDNAKAATKATALLLHLGGVKFCVLGNQETCTGDAARRAGNEFLFQEMRSNNTSLLGSVFGDEKERKIIATCAHCFNTLENEYEAGYTVIHHSIILNQLVNRRRLVPTTPVEGIATYHDPCYLGRQNHMFSQPRDLVNASGIDVVEMKMNRDRAMCCGAGGAQIWIDSDQGERINLKRVDQALETGATTIATACPFCTIMLSDGAKERKTPTGIKTDSGESHTIEVKDISLLLLDAVRRGDQLPQPLKPIPVGDIDVDDRQDAFSVPSDDITVSQELDARGLIDAERTTTSPETTDTVPEPEVEESVEKSSENTATAISLPLVGMLPRPDGVPTPTSPGDTSNNTDGPQLGDFEIPIPIRVHPAGPSNIDDNTAVDSQGSPTQISSTDLSLEMSTPRTGGTSHTAHTTTSTSDAATGSEAVTRVADATITDDSTPTDMAEISTESTPQEITTLHLHGLIHRQDGVPSAHPPLRPQSTTVIKLPTSTSPSTTPSLTKTKDKASTAQQSKKSTQLETSASTSVSEKKTPAPQANDLPLHGITDRTDGVPAARAPMSSVTVSAPLASGTSGSNTVHTTASPTLSIRKGINPPSFAKELTEPTPAPDSTTSVADTPSLLTIRKGIVPPPDFSDSH